MTRSSPPEQNFTEERTVNWFNNLRISTKLFGAFGAVLVLTAALGLMATRDMGVLAHNAEDITSNWLPSVDELHDMNTHAADTRIAQLRAVYAETSEIRARNLQDAQKSAAEMATIARAYETHISSDTERALFKDYSAQWQKYLDLGAAAHRLVEQQKVADAQKLLGEEGDRVYDDSGAALDKLIELNRNGAGASTTASHDIYARS